MSNKKTSLFKNRHFITIFIPWFSAFVFLIFYYAFIQFPMERSFIKGLDYLRQNQLTQASEEFDKVLRVYPAYEPVFLNNAYLYLKDGRLEKSKKIYNYSRWLSLINSEIFTERGLVYAIYGRNQLEEGTDFYNEHVVRNYLSRLFDTYEKE